jgi:hypothetical protein
MVLIPRIGREEAVAGWSPDGSLIAYGRNPDTWPGIWITTRDGTQVRRLQPKLPRGYYLWGGRCAPDGSFMVGANNGPDPQTATESAFWVSPDSRSAVLLLDDAGSAQWQPSGTGKAVAGLSLRHRWTPCEHPKLQLRGQLTIGGQPAPGRRVILGRIRSMLPTQGLMTVTTDHTGRFAALLDRVDGTPFGSAAVRESWRVATAFYPGSTTDWSMTAFDLLAS